MMTVSNPGRVMLAIAALLLIAGGAITDRTLMLVGCLMIIGVVGEELI